MPSAKLRDPTGLGVDPNDVETGLHERDGQWQPDLAQADDGETTVVVHGSSTSVTGSTASVSHGLVLR
jgi:hypothetical protein